MKKNILQLLGYWLFIANHILFIILRDSSSQIILATGILGILIVLLFFYDYQFHFKKTGQFKIHCATLIVLNISMWVFEGSVLFTLINLVLLIGFILLKKQLDRQWQLFE